MNIMGQRRGAVKARVALLLISSAMLLSSDATALTIDEWLERANTPLISVPGGRGRCSPRR